MHVHCSEESIDNKDNIRRKFLKVNSPREAKKLIDFYGVHDEAMHCYAIQCGTLVCIGTKINELEKLDITERKEAIDNCEDFKELKRIKENFKYSHDELTEVCQEIKLVGLQPALSAVCQAI